MNKLEITYRVMIGENERDDEVATMATNLDGCDYCSAFAAASGDINAFESIYDSHWQMVNSICLRMLQNKREAEDLTQEVFIQLYRKIGSFRGDTAFTTWLHRITINQVLMHFRKRKVKFEKTSD